MGQLTPNFLLIMADRMAAPALSLYGNKIVKTPHIEALAQEGVVFDNAYCNSPLCAPSRFSLLSGQLPTRIGAYDNGAEFPSSIPTFVHYLRHMGYRTCLSGKMHFVGPDQLHGFEERITTEVFPSDFGWTPSWEKIAIIPQLSSWPNWDSILDAGVCERTIQIDYDEEVAFQAVRKIYDWARMPEKTPFFMAASFIYPHEPYLITREYWDLYKHNSIKMPTVSEIPVTKLDPHSRRLYYRTNLDKCKISEANIRNVRHAYYSMLSYVDDKIGDLLRALENTGFADNTVVIFTSDHGEMLGERGMWNMMTFYEWAARVPLIVHAPKFFSARRIIKNVSLVDLFPTILEVANGGKMPDVFNPVDGTSLAGLLQGDECGWPDTVFSEHTADYAAAPCLMIRKGRYKYIYCEPDPPQLFDLLTDPKELENLSGRSEQADIERTFCNEVFRCWDPQDLKNRVIESQRRRIFIFNALQKGKKTPWDFNVCFNGSKQYERNYDEDWAVTERRAILPENKLQKQNE